jgi:histidine ammonia-lyase
MPAASDCDPHSASAIRASAAVVQAAAAGDAPVYGVNTGFGKLANQRISAEQLDTLQLNLIRSHSVGVGEPLAPEVVRLMLALKAASLHVASGVREVVVRCSLRTTPARAFHSQPGRVGASGDLAAVAHDAGTDGRGRCVVFAHAVRLPRCCARPICPRSRCRPRKGWR